MGTENVEIHAQWQENTLLSTYIASLVGSNSTVVKDTTTDQNIRYVGKDVNNYVSFNGELWRIIGVFGNNVKIMKADSIGDKQWSTLSSNVWNNSWLKSYLNGDYYCITSKC